MSAFVALPLCALAALCGLTVRVGFLKTPGGRLRLGVSAGPFRRQWTLALSRAEGTIALRLTSARSERLLPLTRRKKKDAGAPIKPALRFLARHVRPERLEARLTVHAGDARSAVLLTALIEGALSALSNLRPDLPLRARVRCAFAGPGEARVMGIFSVRAGHIMLAALLFGREYCVGRLRAWKNTPSKTS